MQSLILCCVTEDYNEVDQLFLSNVFTDDSILVKISPCFLKIKAFSGSRVKRGLYKASNGKLLNADVNGCLNIIRKEFGNDFIRDLFDSGCVFQPMRVTC